MANARTMRLQATERAQQDAAAKMETTMTEMKINPTPIERATRWATSELETAQGKLVQFKARLEANAMDAFKWGDEALVASARESVFAGILTLLASHGFETTVKEVLSLALQGARHPEHSTSALSNLVNEAKTAALAEFADRFGA